MIDITRKHSFPIKVARERAAAIAEKMANQLHLSAQWKDCNTITFAGTTGMAKGVSGSLNISDSAVSVKATLPGMLSLMEKMITDQIVKELDAELKR